MKYWQKFKSLFKQGIRSRFKFLDLDRFRRENQAFIVPTLQGLLFGGVLLVGLTLAYLFDDLFLYLMVFWAIAIYLLTTFLTNEFLRSLRLSLASPQVVEAGQSFFSKLELRNQSFLPALALVITDSGGAVLFQCDQLDGGDSNVFRLKHDFLHRGIHAPLWYKVKSRAPLGLFESWKWVQTPFNFCVHPKALHRLDLTRSSQGVGRGGHEDFQGHLPWTSSHSFRSIDWNVRARTGEWMRKVNQVPLSEKPILRWEATASLQNFENRLSQIVGWIRECERLKLAYFVELPNAHFDSDQHSAEVIFKDLALAQEAEWLS